jgi:hypothetical protein
VAVLKTWVVCECFAEADATHVAGYRTWTSLGRFVRRGEKGIFILAPMVGNKRKKDETEKTEQDTDANETQGTLYGFRGVYVFEGLSRDLRPRFYALDVTRDAPQNTRDSSQAISSINSTALCNDCWQW